MSQDSYASPSIQASGQTFAQLQNGGLSGNIQAIIAANTAIANPTTAPTVSASGGGTSGGNLPAGTYRVAYTWFDGAGETLAKEQSGTFTQTANYIPQVTIPATPAGAAGANIYLTAAGGASGSEVLYATGVTTTTFNMSYAGPANPNAPGVPAANTTGAATIAPKINRLFNGALLQLEVKRLSEMVSQYLSGKPVDFDYFRSELLRIDYAVLAWHQSIKEILTLVAGQAQSLHTASTNVMPNTYRSFP